MTGEGDAARFALRDLVERFGGVCGGDLSRTVTGFAALDTATTEHLAFVAAARFRAAIASSAASAVLVTQADFDVLPRSADRLWVCRDPYLQFARIAQHFEAANRSDTPAGIDATAVVAPTADVHPTAIIGPHVTIGARSRVGAASVIHAGVAIYPDCTIGARCIVHAGVVIGADGFGFARDGAHWVKIPQTGGVVIGDDVEIGANTTIDRGTLVDTRIGDGVKLDNQIQIAHNVQVGDGTIMAACVGIAGSAIVGKRCMIGGAARIMGHVTIADDTVVSTQTFVSRSITRAGHYTGYYPMAEHAAFEKSAAVLRRLDLLRDRVRKLENEFASAKPESTEPER